MILSKCKGQGSCASASAFIYMYNDDNQAIICNASVLPQAMGAPAVWILETLGKRLAKHIDKPLW